MRAAWEYVKGLPLWLVLPAVAVALGGLWAMLRPSSPSRTRASGTTPEAGARRIKEIKTATAEEIKRIEEHGKDKRDKIRDKWGGSLCLLLCAALALSACASRPSRPDAPPWPASHPEPSLTLSEACEYADDDHALVTCPAPLFAASLMQMADVEDSFAVTVADLSEARLSASIREDVALGRVRAAEDRADDAERARWVWALCGLALGATGAGLFVGLLSR